LDEKEESAAMLKKVEEGFSRKDSLILYVKGVIERSKGNEN
jgi:hypothetical protein